MSALVPRSETAWLQKNAAFCQSIVADDRAQARRSRISHNQIRLIAKAELKWLHRSPIVSPAATASTSSLSSSKISRVRTRDSDLDTVPSLDTASSIDVLDPFEPPAKLTPCAHGSHTSRQPPPPHSCQAQKNSAGVRLIQDEHSSPQPIRDRDLDLSESDPEIEPIRKRLRLSPPDLQVPDFCVSLPSRAFPDTVYRSIFESGDPLSNHELRAIDKLDQQSACRPRGNTDNQYICYRLEDFCIYRPVGSAHHGGELISLEKLHQQGCSDLRFDGILCLNGVAPCSDLVRASDEAGSKDPDRYFVSNVPFSIHAIEGYGDDTVHTMGDGMYIQSVTAERRNIWYKLGSPSQAYARFYKPYLWLAQFGKYFADYLTSVDDEMDITLAHFRSRFHKWLMRQTYADNQEFRRWQTAYDGKTDFRVVVASNLEFLWKECYGLNDTQLKLHRHAVWKEVGLQEPSAIKLRSNKHTRTVVTPYAYHCFKNMYFRDYLDSRDFGDSLNVVTSRKATLGLAPTWDPSSRDGSINTTSKVPSDSTKRSGHPDHVDHAPQHIHVGDVVMIPPDVSTAWKTTTHVWYAYVQGVRIDEKNGRKMLDILWMYEPHDTTIGKSYYPYDGELFLSDNCSCGSAAVDAAETMGSIKVTWMLHVRGQAQDPATSPTRHFVRQKFRTVHSDDTYDFVSATESDFRCLCRTSGLVSTFDDVICKYNPGDTVLVRERCPGHDDRLQPAMTVDFQRQTKRVMIRWFERKSHASTDNELFMSANFTDVAASRVIRRCQIRNFASSDQVLPPYNRGGTGDFFYCLPSTADNIIEDDSATRPTMTSGWDPRGQVPNKLRGLGLFCGGGNFDHGLQEGGMVDFQYAVDWDTYALHSYRANADLQSSHMRKRPQCYLGSVNDYLAQAMSMSNDPAVAKPGDVDLISAGSPCPGFSSLQKDKLSEASKCNASLVASVVAMVDFYVPERFMLENVVTMTQGMGPNKDENVFAQIVSALVGLGYQAQQFLMDAWNYGSSQQRSRVFIVATAPGLQPLRPPPHSHAHPLNDVQSTGSRRLGTSSNGLPFGSRRSEFTAFPHVSARESVADLPDVSDAQVHLCVPFPDHRTGTSESTRSRARIRAVPIWPRGMTLMKGYLDGRVTGEPAELCAKLQGRLRGNAWSKMYSRLYPDRLVPTIVTALVVADGIAGRTLHWDQHRMLTIMEARRVQGFLDSDMLIGPPSKKMKIVGNSVDRKVALVLGLALRDAYHPYIA